VKEEAQEEKRGVSLCDSKRAEHSPFLSREELLSIKKKMEVGGEGSRHGPQTSHSSYTEIINIQPLKKDLAQSQIQTLETFKKTQRDSTFKSSPFASPKT